MSYLKLFKNSFFQFQDLQQAKKIILAKVVGHLTLLSFILAIPITVQTMAIFQSVQQDAQEIAQMIPNFTIQDGNLSVDSKEKGFIYQTDSIIFTFDPDEKRTAEEVEQDLVGNFFSIGLLKNQIIIILPASENLTTLLGSNQLKIPYSNPALSGLNGADLRASLLNNQLPWWIIPLTLSIAIYPTFLSMIFTTLMTTLIANLYLNFRRIKPHFLDTYKILVFASTLPVILAACVSYFAPGFATDTFIMMASFFIFTLSLKRPQEKNS